MNKRFSTLYYNPWLGPSSYPDPQSSEHRHKFCGREKEIVELTHLIDEYFFVTLYGMSGIGKSSLLNAGVFSELRKMQYLPISIRLLLVQDDENFQQNIIKCIEQTITRTGGHIEIFNVVEEETDITKDDFLWNYFARHRFYEKSENLVFPVIVMDQFEEVLRSSDLRRGAEKLLSQIAYLIDEDHAINDCIVDGEEYSYDFNFRFVLSIREDDLYRLEDSIDKGYLVSLKQNRYRLRGMNRENAERVVKIPSMGFISDDVACSILDNLKENRGEDDDVWSPAILSLFLYLYYENEVETDTLDVFANYYHDATSSQIIDADSLTYLEDRLLTDVGNRNLMLLSEAQNKVSAKALNNLISCKIIQVEKRNGVDYIEFSHDRLCAEAKKNRELRVLQMQKKKFYKRLLLILSLAICICLAVSFFCLHLNKTNRELDIAKNQLEKSNEYLKLEKEQSEKTNIELRSRNHELEMIKKNLSTRNIELEKTKRKLNKTIASLNQTRLTLSKIYQKVDSSNIWKDNNKEQPGIEKNSKVSDITSHIVLKAIQDSIYGKSNHRTVSE